MLRPCLFLAALTLCACESPPKPDAPVPNDKPAQPADAPKPAGEVPEAKPEATAKPVPRAQLAAPLTLAIRPAQWSALHGSLLPLLAKLPDDVEPLRKATSPQDVAGLIAAAVFAVPPPEFQGWDASRPILLALGETDNAALAGGGVGQLPLEEGWVPGIRHQAEIPASDPKVLLDSLSKLMSSSGGSIPELTKGRTGAAAMPFDEWSVVLLPADNAVRIVVFEAYVGLPPDKAFAHMRERLDTPIYTTESAAAQVLKDDGAALTAWFRPDRLRALAITSGAGHMFSAIATAPAEVKGQLTATGTSLLISSDAVMVDEGAEVDEVAMSLRVDEGALRLQQLAVLSDEGEKAIAAATKDVSPTFAAAVRPVWADLVVRANVRALLDAVEPPSFARPGESLNAVSEAAFEGGSFALLHLGTRHGLGLARFAELAVGSLPVPTDTAPTAAHVVWAGMTKDEMPRLAMALHWPKAHDITALTKLLQEGTKDPDFTSLKVHTTEYEGAPTHVLGFGGLSEKAFATDTPSPAQPLIDLHVDVPTIAAEFAKDDPEVAAWFGDTSETHFTLRHHPHALAAELVWSPGGGQLSVEPAAPPAVERSAKPVGNPARTEAERCVGKAGFAYAGVLRAVAHASSESLGGILTKGLKEAGQAVSCAEAEPKSKAAVHGLRRVAIATLLDSLSDAALKSSIREQQCAIAKDASYCKPEAPAPGK